jgi:hypothetical protein
MATAPSTPISTAAINWIDPAGQVHVAVYSSDGYNITERIWNADGWTTGSFTATGDDVSATCWVGPGGLSIRVYCTYQDVTKEWCIDGAGSGGTWRLGNYSPA